LSRCLSAMRIIDGERKRFLRPNLGSAFAAGKGGRKKGPEAGVRHPRAGGDFVTILYTAITPHQGAQWSVTVARGAGLGKQAGAPARRG